MYRHAIRRKSRMSGGVAALQQAAARGTVPPLWSLANIPARPGHGALVQPKLIVGAANDPAERAADRAADQVMRMGDPAAPVAAGAAASGRVMFGFRRGQGWSDFAHEIRWRDFWSAMMGPAIDEEAESDVARPSRPQRGRKGNLVHL